MIPVFSRPGRRILLALTAVEQGSGPLDNVDVAV